MGWCTMLMQRFLYVASMFNPKHHEGSTNWLIEVRSTENIDRSHGNGPSNSVTHVPVQILPRLGYLFVPWFYKNRDKNQKDYIHDNNE